MTLAYAVGCLMSRLNPPFSRLQMNLRARELDVTDAAEIPRVESECLGIRVWSDQADADAFLSAPTHRDAVQQIDH